MAFDTSSTNWDFDFDVIPGTPNGTTYPFALNFYLYRPSSSSYYHGLTWKLTFNINGVAKSFEYKNPNNINVPKGTLHKVWGDWVSVDMPGGYDLNLRTIQVSCSFTSNGSPSSGSGTKNVTIAPNASAAGQTQFTIQDNGDNTFSFVGNVGHNGDNNTVTNAHIYFNIDKPNDPSTSSYDAVTWALPNNSNTAEYDGFNQKMTSYKIQGQDRRIKARSYTIDERGSRPDFLANSISCWYYSNPGVPKDLQIKDMGNNTATISAKIGDSGSHNTAQSLEIQYSLGNRKNWQSYHSPIRAAGQTIYARARTVGSYTGPKNTNTFTYSDYVYVQSNIKQYTTPGKPKVEIIDNGDNTFKFKVQVGVSGDNNSASGVSIYYTTNGQKPGSGSKKIFISGGHTGQWIYSANIDIPVTDANNPHSSINVNCRAVTEGSYTGNSRNFYYSSEISADGIVYYYQTPKISKPIITYDKKLNKKSQIKVDFGCTVYQHADFKSYTLFLYNNSKQCYEYQKEIDWSIDNANPLGLILDHTIDLKDITSVKFKKGDKLCVKVEYIIQNSKGDNLINNENNTLVPTSDLYSIESSGVMRVNVNNDWHEGQVWVNIGGVWKEATDVFINNEGIWKESV